MSRFIKCTYTWICGHNFMCANTPQVKGLWLLAPMTIPCCIHRVSDWESMAIPGRQAGSNRLKMDSRHCRHWRGHYHIEVRLWFWTVNRQRFYLERPARTTPRAFNFSMLFKSANFIFNIAAAPAKHMALFIFIVIPPCSRRLWDHPKLVAYVRGFLKDVFTTDHSVVVLQ